MLTVNLPVGHVIHSQQSPSSDSVEHESRGMTECVCVCVCVCAWRGGMCVV